MTRNGWNQSDLARRIGKEPSVISRWLAGKRPSSDSCDLIADAIGVSVDTVLTMAGHRPAPADFNPDDLAARLAERIRMESLSSIEVGSIAALLDHWQRTRGTGGA